MDNGFLRNGRTVDAVRRFGHELRCRRTQAGLTQRQLAERVRYSREMVAAVERGRRYGSQELAVRCDEVLGTGGVLGRLWPMVESEQVAADRRRGPRLAPPTAPATSPGTPATPPGTPVTPPGPPTTPPGWPVNGWADWAERIRPAIDEVPPELAGQLRDLINNLVLASGRDSG
jgi:DNA-binding XRE family transcriptional regulator